MKRLRSGHLAKLALCAMLLAGCAQVPRDAGFSDVQRTVSTRIDKRVAWSRDAKADHAIHQAVGHLLKGKLTAEAAVQIALLNNRDLQATYENLGIAQAQLVAAGLLKNPVFDGAVKFDLGDGGNITELSVAQNFLDVLFIPVRQKIAAARFEQTKLQVSDRVLQLAGRTRRAFYALQADQQLAQMLQSVVQATGDAYAVAARLHQAGNITQLDVDRQQALYDASKIQLAAAQTAVTQAREQLNRLMGLWGSRTQWTIADRLPKLPGNPIALDDVERRAITASLNLAQARQGVEALGRRVGISGLASIFQQDASVGVTTEHDPGGPWAVGPSLSIPIPLFDLGQSALAETKARVRQAYQAYTATAVDIRSQARALRARLLAQRREVVFDQDRLLPLRRRITQRSQLQYNAMQIGVFELLQAKRLEIDAGQQYVQTLRDYWLTRSTLDQLLAGSMPPMTEPSTNGSSPAAVASGISTPATSSQNHD